MMPFWLNTVLIAIEVACFTAITLWYLRERRRISGKKEISANRLYWMMWSQEDDTVESLDSVIFANPTSSLASEDRC